MKQLISMLLVLCMALILSSAAVAEGGRQTASTVLDRDGDGIMVTVDLTGGWSVEFASGALFLYSGEITEGREADAVGVTLDKEVYDEYIAEAEDSESRREIENGVCFSTDESTYYAIAVGSSAYFLLDVPAGADGDAILARLDLVNEDDYYAAEMEALEGAAEAETDLDSFIKDGSFIIQIPDPEGDMGWVADDMAQDDTVVTLYDADLIEDTFVVRYDPVGDGDVTVGVRHYTGIACDEAFTWDLHVADGAVQEVIGGSHTASPDEAELDPYLLGEWLEQETQFTQMTIEKNAERGWDVEIVSPMTHGAYVFKATVFYDCEQYGFIYDNGDYWDVPITDSEEEPELGEAKVSGTTGIFVLEGDDQNLLLSWYDDQRPEEEVVFERCDAEDEADADS